MKRFDLLFYSFSICFILNYAVWFLEKTTFDSLSLFACSVSDFIKLMIYLLYQIFLKSDLHKVKFISRLKLTEMNRYCYGQFFFISLAYLEHKKFKKYFRKIWIINALLL